MRRLPVLTTFDVWLFKTVIILAEYLKESGDMGDIDLGKRQHVFTESKLAKT